MKILRSGNLGSNFTSSYKRKGYSEIGFGKAIGYFNLLL